MTVSDVNWVRRGLKIDHWPWHTAGLGEIALVQHWEQKPVWSRFKWELQEQIQLKDCCCEVDRDIIKQGTAEERSRTKKRVCCYVSKDERYWWQWPNRGDSNTEKRTVSICCLNQIWGVACNFITMWNRVRKSGNFDSCKSQRLLNVTHVLFYSCRYL